MLAKLRSGLTFANVTALTALFLALCGGAYALTLPKNSVGTKQLKRHAVTGPKIKRNAVTSSKVKFHSLLAEDFKPGELPTGGSGPQGERGLQGDPGMPGQDATKLFGYIRDTSNDANPAIVYYGVGVDSVFDPDGSGHFYDVAFNRSLDACVVLALPGTGLPQGTPNAEVTSFPTVTIAADGNPAHARVLFHTTNNLQTDTSFMIAAFC
jgi:hypothetical protein